MQGYGEDKIKGGPKVYGLDGSMNDLNRDFPLKNIQMSPFLPR